MKRCFFYLIAILMLATPLDFYGKSYYNTVSNDFGSLFPFPGMRMAGRYKAIVDDYLVEENATMANAITIDTMGINSTSYRYQMRLANHNNKQGKSVSVKNPMSSEKTTLTSTEWGVIFNYDGQGNYYAAVLSCDNSTLYDDITDKRQMTVKVIKRNGTNTTELAHTTISKGVSLEDDMNTLSVAVDERNVQIAIGKEELIQVLEVEITRPVGTVYVGYLVGPGASVAIERAVLTIENEKQVITTTPWTIEALDEHFASSDDPMEGYWKYLDRDMEDKWLRLGGRYTLATVRTDDGYDLLYINGAQVKKSLWQSGMLKGHMTKTIFSGNYNLTWIDATMEPIDKDAYATIENGVILTLEFPVFKSQVRFAKVINIDD